MLWLGQRGPERWGEYTPAHGPKYLNSAIGGSENLHMLTLDLSINFSTVDTCGARVITNLYSQIERTGSNACFRASRIWNRG